jgi:type 1 glutamine amidotransferase
MKKVLIVFGGWEGHDPIGFSKFFYSIFKKNGFQVEVSNSLNVLRDEKNLLNNKLISRKNSIIISPSFPLF